jgi:hypothetical protein
MIKYIIFADEAGHEHPVIFSSSIQHSSLARYDLRAVSAGFLMVGAGRVVVPDVPSTSLNLGPRAGDAALLQAWLGVTP